MPHRSSPTRRAGLIVVALVAGACTGGTAAPTWTFAPGPSTSTPAAVTPLPPGGPTAATPVAATPPAPPTTGPTPPGAQSHGDGLTDEEWAALTTAWNIRHAEVDSPAVSGSRAEAVVRERYPGDRPLVWSGLVVYGDSPRVGWMVVLGVAPGQACAIHPGLLERALEGAIVDASTGEIFFTMTCG